MPGGSEVCFFSLCSENAKLNFKINLYTRKYILKFTSSKFSSLRIPRYGFILFSWVTEVEFDHVYNKRFTIPQNFSLRTWSITKFVFFLHRLGVWWSNIWLTNYFILFLCSKFHQKRQLRLKANKSWKFILSFLEKKWS